MVPERLEALVERALAGSVLGKAVLDPAPEGLVEIGIAGGVVVLQLAHQVGLTTGEYGQFIGHLGNVGLERAGLLRGLTGRDGESFAVGSEDAPGEEPGDGVGYVVLSKSHGRGVAVIPGQVLVVLTVLPAVVVHVLLLGPAPHPPRAQVTDEIGAPGVGSLRRGVG